MSFLDEHADRECVFVGVSTGKALVGHVKERVVLLLLHHVADLSPLSFRRVDTGRVVGTSMQQDNAAFRSSFDVGNHTVEVEADSVLVVVPILLDLQPGVLENGIVIGPARRREEYGLAARVEPLQEGASNAKSTCAGYRLCDGNPVLFKGLRFTSVGQLRSCLCECRYTGDASILLVEVRVNHLLFGGAYGG